MTARQRFWLSAGVMCFCVAMTCMLLAFKHRAVLEGLQRERVQLVATEVRALVERSLSFGMALGQIPTLPEFLQSQRLADPLVDSIDFADSSGRILYSTSAGRAGSPIEEAAREAMKRASGDGWRVRAGEGALEAAVARNAFGLAVGHAVVRYRMDALDAATLRFTRRLGASGAVIALVATALLFMLLRFVDAGGERRIAHAVEAFEGANAPADEPMAATAREARGAIAAARADLDEAEAALGAARQ